jgi:hypothetical protein
MLPQPPPAIIAMVLLALLSLTNLVPVQSVILEGNPTAAAFLPVVVGVVGLVGAWGVYRELSMRAYYVPRQLAPYHFDEHTPCARRTRG